MRLLYGRFGLMCDPRGAQVLLRYQGRTLLGDVRGVERDEITGASLLIVHHFNGEPWPIRPVASAVEMLARN